MRAEFGSGRVSEADTSAEITTSLNETGELLCPHTAVGVKVGKAHLGDTPMITLATAHPAKFPAAVKDATGLHPDLPPHMADLFEREERLIRVAGDLAAVQAIIKEKLA